MTPCGRVGAGGCRKRVEHKMLFKVRFYFSPKEKIKLLKKKICFIQKLEATEGDGFMVIVNNNINGFQCCPILEKKERYFLCVCLQFFQEMQKDIKKNDCEMWRRGFKKAISESSLWQPLNPPPQLTTTAFVVFLTAFFNNFSFFFLPSFLTTGRRERDRQETVFPGHGGFVISISFKHFFSRGERRTNTHPRG